MYTTEDYGLFLGFMTMPFGKEEDFIEVEIKNLFAQYKENIRNNLKTKPKKDSEFEQLLFEPRVYYLMGNFSLFITALIDDFSLGTRNFHPFSHLIEDKLEQFNEARIAEGKEPYHPQNYTFHVISGVVPDLRYINPSVPSLVDRATETFLEREANKDKYPLVAISSLKLNNAFLIGGGGNYVDLVLRKIKRVIEQMGSASPGNLQYIILHSFSWHEISIIFFSNSFSKITEQIFAIRELSFGDLYLDEYSTYWEEILNASLLTHFISKNDTSLSNEELVTKAKAAHIFVNTHTSFGYDPRLFSGDIDLNGALNKELRLYSRWDMKPGHLKSFIYDLKQLVQANELKNIEQNWRITVGRGDFVHAISKNIFDSYGKFIQKMIDEKFVKHVRNLNTTPELQFVSTTPLDEAAENVKPSSYVSVSDHFFFHDELNKFCFSLADIRKVRSLLKTMRVSKTLREKITNMFISFNDGLFDPVLYGYFIELKPYLKTVIETLEWFISKADKLSVDGVTEQLTQMADRFEIGYKNRFGQSYIMNEITDFNIDFNGGIQQLTAAYDGAYKSLTSLLGEFGTGRSIAYVAGHSNIESDHLSVCLNYFHLYQPEFFAAAATHEAANFFYDRYPDDGTAPEVEEMKKDLLKIFEEEEEEWLLDYIDYAFPDIAAYYLTFSNDFELFFYWHWCSFIQTGVMYRLDGSIDQLIFDRFMLRMLLIAKLTNHDSFFIGKIIPPFETHNTAVYRAWEVSMLKGKKRVRILTDHKYNCFSYFRKVRKYILGLVLEDFVSLSDRNSHQLNIKNDLIINGDRGKRILELKENDINPQFISDVEDLEIGIDNNVKENLLYGRRVYMNSIASQIKENFRQGLLYDFSGLKKEAALSGIKPSFFYQTLFLAYLRVIKELSNDKAFLLDRVVKDGQVRNEQLDGDLLYDPTGGIFSRTIEARKSYFKYRVLFLKSLWVLSMRMKTNLFRLNKNA